MHAHRNAGTEPAPRRAATPPPAGNVHGLGVVDALRIDLQPAQLPWLAAEIDILRYCLEDELAHQRARHDELPDSAKKHHRATPGEAEQELERRAYQLQALAMIRDRLPLSREAARPPSPARGASQPTTPRSNRSRHRSPSLGRRRS